MTLRRETMDCADRPSSRIRTRPPAARWLNLTVSRHRCRGAIIYLHTDNLAATLDRVASAGGSCVFGPLALPNDIGTIALFTDSEGNRVGLHQPVLT